MHFYVKKVFKTFLNVYYNYAGQF